MKSWEVKEVLLTQPWLLVDEQGKEGWTIYVGDHSPEDIVDFQPDQLVCTNLRVGKEEIFSFSIGPNEISVSNEKGSAKWEILEVSSASLSISYGSLHYTYIPLKAAQIDPTIKLEKGSLETFLTSAIWSEKLEESRSQDGFPYINRILFINRHQRLNHEDPHTFKSLIQVFFTDYQIPNELYENPFHKNGWILSIYKNGIILTVHEFMEAKTQNYLVIELKEAILHLQGKQDSPSKTYINTGGKQV
ncbi:MAG: hypothetical protein AAF824_16175 [Bacteroidota bacterium]